MVQFGINCFYFQAENKTFVDYSPIAQVDLVLFSIMFLNIWSLWTVEWAFEIGVHQLKGQDNVQNIVLYLSVFTEG